MTFSGGSSLGTLELQLTANQQALQQQLNQTRAYATQVARDIEQQINRAFGGSGRTTQLPGLRNAPAQGAQAGADAGRSFADKFKDAIAPVKGAIDSIFNGGLEKAGASAFSSVTGAIGTAIDAVKGFAGQIFNVTKDFQGFESSLKTFLKGNQQEIDKFVAGLEKFAATTPYELKDLQSAAIQNLATGAKPDQILKDLKSIGDVAAGANASIKDLMEVYAKSRTEGRLQNDDIDQFTGRGVQLRAQLAKQLGASEQEVWQLATDGKLEFRHLEEAIRAMSGQGGAYFDAMKNKAQTLECKLSNVNDTFYQFQKQLGQAFEPLFSVATDFLGQLVSGLTDNKDLMAELKGQTQELANYFKQNPEIAENLSKALNELVRGAMAAMVAGAKQLGEYLKENPRAIQDAVSGGIQLGREVAGVVTSAASLVTYIVQFTNGVKDAALAVRDTLGGAMKAIGIGEKKDNPIANFLGGDISQSQGDFKDKLYGKNAPGFMQAVGKLLGYEQKSQSQNSSSGGGTNPFLGTLIGGVQSLFGGGNASTSNSNRGGVAGQVTMRRTGEKDEYGLEKIAVILPDGQTFYANTGQRRTQNQFGKGGTTRSGSMAPIEYGRYQLGGETAGMSAGVGSTFIPINPTFKTDRASIGFHLDANRTVAPGSAGCVVFSTQQEFNAFRAALKQSGAKQLVFEDGKGVGIADAAQGVSVGKVQGADGFLGAIANQVKKFLPKGLPTGAGLSSQAANVVRGKNEQIFQQAGVTDTLVKLVKEAEGFAATPYFDRTQYSVGFGTKAKSQGERLTVELANERLLAEIQANRQKVRGMVKVPINNNQLDALTSFSFNVGDGSFGSSTLLKKLNAGDYEGAAAEFARWNKGEDSRGKKVELPGLTRRRGAERDLFLSQQSAYGPPLPTSTQLASTPQTTPGLQSIGGNEEDQRNLITARRKLAEQNYKAIKDELDFATVQADATQKQQRELAAQKREQLNKEKKAQLQLAATQAPDDEAKQVIERRISRYELDNKYEEELIKLAQQHEDLTDVRDKKLQIAAEAKKQGKTVDFGAEGGKDYTKAINQLDEVIASTKELQKLELQTNNLADSNADKKEEQSQVEQRNLSELTRAHDELIAKLKVEQEAAKSQEIKQKIQIEIDTSESKFQLQQALIPMQRQLDDLKKRKVYLLGEAGLKDDSDEVKRLQAQIVELEKQISATTAKSQSDLTLIQKEADKAIEAAKFTDQTSALNKEQGLVGGRTSVLQGQATLIRNRGGNEYQASALEAEASKMQEQIRYKQELLQIEQQIASARGTSSEYTETEITTMKANAETLSKLNLENISQGVRTLGKDLMDVSKNALGGFFTDIITGSKSAGEAFQDLIGNIANQLAQLAVNQLISGLFGGGGGIPGMGKANGGGLLGGLLGFYQGGIVPNYATGGSVGAIASALQRERSASGRNPVLAALTPGEMVLTVEQAKRFQELRLDKVLNFANGGVVGSASSGGEIGKEGMTINIPVTVTGAKETSVDVPRLQSSIRSVVVEELLKQQRPGGALNR
jgi:GH24 family phage-related lysozyme (muramidase)